MEKILVFIDWYLPGYKAGGPIRSVANMVEHLADQYNFFIVTRNTDYLEINPYPDIQSDKWVKISDNQQVMYLSEKAVSIKSIRKIIKGTAVNWVYINGVYSFYFSLLPLILMRYFNKTKTIVAPRGMLSAQGLGVKSFKKRAFIFLSRIVGLYKKSIIHVTSSKEKTDIEDLNLKAEKIALIPNLSPKISDNQAEIIGKRAGELKLVSIARISPEKNTLFALECLKNFEYTGEIFFDIYGSVYNKSYWKQCLEVIQALPANIKVTYKGGLDNLLVSRYLKKYHFLYLPSKGENFGHSILESFLASRPVIISDKTPWRGLEYEKVGWDLDLNSPGTFAKYIQQALELSNEEFSTMAESAFKYAIAMINVEQSKKDYCKLFA